MHDKQHHGRYQEAAPNECFYRLLCFYSICILLFISSVFVSVFLALDDVFIVCMQTNNGQNILHTCKITQSEREKKKELAAPEINTVVRLQMF